MSVPESDILIKSLRSTECPMCGSAKRMAQTMCPGCYRKLSPETKQDLYRRIGNGYEAAVEKAMAELGVAEFKNPPDRARPPSTRPTKCEDVVMPFGKHQGKRLGDLLDEDPSYLDWLQTADISSAMLARAVAEMNEKYEGQIEQAIELKRSER